MTEQEKQALLDFRNHNRKVAELNRELFNMKELIITPHFKGQDVWAKNMVKSIAHELDQLKK